MLMFLKFKKKTQSPSPGQEKFSKPVRFFPDPGIPIKNEPSLMAHSSMPIPPGRTPGICHLLGFGGGHLTENLFPEVGQLPIPLQTGSFKKTQKRRFVDSMYMLGTFEFRYLSYMTKKLSKFWT